MLTYILITIFIFFILYILSIMPKVFGKKDFASFEGRYYAHRGLHQEKDRIPENSLSAFKLAVENNYGIELDVQLSKDGEPVIFHDNNLKRVCGLDKLVVDLTFAELRNLNLYNSKEKIPHLQEVLDLVDGQIPLIVEFKLESFDTKICDIVAPYLDSYKGVYCVESFHPAVVNWYKKNRPHIIRGQLSANELFPKGKVSNKFLNFILKNLMLNFWGRPDFIAYEHDYGNTLSLILTRKLFRAPAIAYTVQSQAELEAAIKYFDLFIFDMFIPNPKTLGY